MTLLVSWIGKDSRKVSSVYIASDSRFSWGKPLKYDYGRKVFALANSPDILGYCGDVLYPTTIINQLLDMDREGILFPVNSSSEERSEILFNEISSKFDSYPSEKIAGGTIEILHISRQNSVDFICNVFKWTNNSGWNIVKHKIPETSDKIITLGSGKDEFLNRYLEYYKGLNGKTSRAIFQCLCNSLFKIKDLQCGGAPQLVGLYNKYNGKNFGIIYEEKRFFLGRHIKPSELVNRIEWRNELFERCDGITGRILNGAQRQPDNLRL